MHPRKQRREKLTETRGAALSLLGKVSQSLFECGHRNTQLDRIALDRYEEQHLLDRGPYLLDQVDYVQSACLGVLGPRALLFDNDQTQRVLALFPAMG